MQRYTVYFVWKLLYMFRVVPPPIIRRANNCTYSIWYLSQRYCYLSLSWKRQVAVTLWQIPDAVGTVVCAPDDGWWYHPKHVEQFPDKINCVTLHLVGHILEYNSSTSVNSNICCILQCTWFLFLPFLDLKCIYSNSKICLKKIYYKYSVDAPATVQTKSKVASWKTAFKNLSRNTVNSSHW